MTMGEERFTLRRTTATIRPMEQHLSRRRVSALIGNDRINEI
jgi:hypothetical protein